MTRERFEDPVVAADCFTYEREATSMWFQNHGTSPMTNGRVRTHRACPNLTLRSLLDNIDDIKQAGNGPAPPPHRRGESSSTDGDGPRGQRRNLVVVAAEVDELAEDLAATTIAEGLVASPKATFLPHAEAEAVARSLDFKKQKEWQSWSAANTSKRLECGLPQHYGPNRTNEWKGWRAWLGAGPPAAACPTAGPAPPPNRRGESSSTDGDGPPPATVAGTGARKGAFETADAVTRGGRLAILSDWAQANPRTAALTLASVVALSLITLNCSRTPGPASCWTHWSAQSSTDFGRPSVEGLWAQCDKGSGRCR